MPTRRSSRRLALEALYESDLTQGSPTDALARHSNEGAHAFALDLVSGVTSNLPELDSLISQYSQEWELHRMPAIDRNLLRLGVFEILFVSEIPSAVSINEAVDLAKEYSTENSGKFINGVLASISESEAARA